MHSQFKIIIEIVISCGGIQFIISKDLSSHLITMSQDLVHPYSAVKKYK